MPDTSGNSLDQHTFKKLSRLYILALSAIAVTVILSQILIHQYLEDQESDSTVVNIAGRQRMLSQKLTKETLQLLIAGQPSEKEQLKENIKSTLALWDFSYYALLEGSDSLGLPGNNSDRVKEMFQQIQPSFLKMKEASSSIVEQLEKDPNTPLDQLSDEIFLVKTNEVSFLQGMDNIVNQYEKEAGDKVDKLGNLELFLMAVTLLILLSEFLFIFWPAAKGVRHTIHNLIMAESKAKKMAHDADELSQAKEKSVKELRVLNQAMNQTLLFARLTSEGDIIQIGEKFSRLFKIRKFADFSKFQDLLSGNEVEKKNIESLLEENFRKGWQGEVKATTTEGADVWMEMSLIPFSPVQDKWEILVIAIDITTRKEAQLEIERLTKRNFEEKMNQQKLISSKIIENQENEQNRIAKDIHDGIGQMLTGFSFNLESIDVTNTEKAAQKIEGLKDLTAKIIKGVRTATFNLMPPELSDHGIIPALTKLSLEL
ncbi:MAG TPA: type IV pili methyl-accepting chemotaxis transducer N-terminal domain-containing protein, partial [Gillisia sp.]|nr:type IV pili methyl-accepting chemotaxis transducer N-terminal domain-containing protein [Gillisia sp.]